MRPISCKSLAEFRRPQTTEGSEICFFRRHVRRKKHCQDQCRYWSENSGAVAIVAGEVEMIGESADYDGWRIESMELACHYDELEGAALDVYRLGWRLHTTTPDRVILAGPEDPYPTLPEGRELLTLGRWTDPRIPAGNGWYYLPVSDFTWYPRSQFWADYQEVLTWLTSRAVFTLY